MDQDEQVPFSLQEQGGPEAMGPMGPRVRENVDAGTDVINLTQMREQLEAERRRRGGG